MIETLFGLYIEGNGEMGGALDTEKDQVFHLVERHCGNNYKWLIRKGLKAWQKNGKTQPDLLKHFFERLTNFALPYTIRLISLNLLLFPSAKPGLILAA